VGDDRPFLTAQWRDLLLLNYEVPESLLDPLVPAGTRLDRVAGRLLASVVGFRFLDTRVRGWSVPFHRHFEEVNLRFYVRRALPSGEVRRAVVFVRELVPKRAVAWVARVVYNEPYLAVPMGHRLTRSAPDGPPSRVEYSWAFKAQATVVELLWLDGLNKQLSLSQPSGTARRSVLFSQADTAWRHAMQMGAPRPAAFKTPELAELVDLGGPARLFWRAADVTQPATLLEMIGDLEQIWYAGMQAAIGDYAAAFEMLGRFHGATAEIREGQGRLVARLVLVAASESAAKRASGALALASALGKLVAGGAVRSGQMTAAAAAALDSVLGSIETRVVGARLTVQLGIDVTTLREALQ
jgi:hypothetical protein